MRFSTFALFLLLTPLVAQAALIDDLRAVEGTYTGQIVGKETVPVIIILSIGGTVNQPILTGYYKRPDVAGGVIDLPIREITYEPTATPENLTMEAHGTNRYHLFFRGYVGGGQMRVRVNSAYLGDMGQADLIRQ